MTKDKNNTIEFMGRLNILVVDDNLRIRQIIGWMLESVDCHLMMAADGKKALEEFKKVHYDLILMDLQMPEMNGFETTARIRAIESETGGHIPILAMADFHLENGRQRCVNAGMDDYLEKPFKIEELFETIERLAHTKFK